MATAGAQFVDLGGVSVHVPKLTQSQQLIAACRDGGDDACEKLAKATGSKLVTEADVAGRDAEVEELQRQIKAQAAAAEAPATPGSGKLGAVPKTPGGQRAGNPSAATLAGGADSSGNEDKPTDDDMGVAAAEPPWGSGAPSEDQPGAAATSAGIPPAEPLPSGTASSAEDTDSSMDEDVPQTVVFNLTTSSAGTAFEQHVSLVNAGYPFIEGEQSDREVHRQALELPQSIFGMYYTVSNEPIPRVVVSIEYNDTLRSYFDTLWKFQQEVDVKSSAFYEVDVYVEDKDTYADLVAEYTKYLPVEYVYKQMSSECGPSAVANALAACGYFKGTKPRTASQRIFTAMNPVEGGFIEDTQTTFSEVCANMELESYEWTPTLASGVPPKPGRPASLLVRAHELGGELAVIYGLKGEISYKARLLDQRPDENPDPSLQGAGGNYAPFVQAALSLLDTGACGLIVPSGGHYTAVVKSPFDKPPYIVLDSLTQPQPQGLRDPSNGTIRYVTDEEAVLYIGDKVRSAGAKMQMASGHNALGVLLSGDSASLALEFFYELQSAVDSGRAVFGSYFCAKDYNKIGNGIKPSPFAYTFGATHAEAVEAAASTFSDQQPTDLNFGACSVYDGYPNVTVLPANCFDGGGDARHALFTLKLDEHVKDRLDKLYARVQTPDKEHYPQLPPAFDDVAGKVNKKLYCKEMVQVGDPTPNTLYQLAGIKAVLIEVNSVDEFNLALQHAKTTWSSGLPPGLDHVYVLYAADISSNVERAFETPARSRSRSQSRSGSDSRRRSRSGSGSRSPLARKRDNSPSDNPGVDATRAQTAEGADDEENLLGYNTNDEADDDADADGDAEDPTYAAGTSSPSPPEAAISDAAALAQQAAVQAQGAVVQPPGTPNIDTVSDDDDEFDKPLGSSALDEVSDAGDEGGESDTTLTSGDELNSDDDYGSNNDEGVQVLRQKKPVVLSDSDTDSDESPVSASPGQQAEFVDACNAEACTSECDISKYTTVNNYDEKGYGLAASVNIAKNTRIGVYKGVSGTISIAGKDEEYVAEYASMQDFDAFLDKLKQDGQDKEAAKFEMYSIKLESNVILSAYDPGRSGKPDPAVALANHNGENPNTIFANWGTCTALETLKDIQAGEELTIDYGSTYNFAAASIPVAVAGRAVSADTKAAFAYLVQWMNYWYGSKEVTFGGKAYLPVYQVEYGDGKTTFGVYKGHYYAPKSKSDIIRVFGEPVVVEEPEYGGLWFFTIETDTDGRDVPRPGHPKKVIATKEHFVTVSRQPSHAEVCSVAAACINATNFVASVMEDLSAFGVALNNDSVALWYDDEENPQATDKQLTYSDYVRPMPDMLWQALQADVHTGTHSSYPIYHVDLHAAVSRVSQNTLLMLRDPPKGSGKENPTKADQEAYWSPIESSSLRFDKFKATRNSTLIGDIHQALQDVDDRKELLATSAEYETVKTSLQAAQIEFDARDLFVVRCAVCVVSVSCAYNLAHPGLTAEQTVKLSNRINYVPVGDASGNAAFKFLGPDVANDLINDKVRVAAGRNTKTLATTAHFAFTSKLMDMAAKSNGITAADKVESLWQMWQFPENDTATTVWLTESADKRYFKFSMVTWSDVKRTLRTALGVYEESLLAANKVLQAPDGNMKDALEQQLTTYSSASGLFGTAQDIAKNAFEKAEGEFLLALMSKSRTDQEKSTVVLLDGSTRAASRVIVNESGSGSKKKRIAPLLTGPSTKSRQKDVEPRVVGAELEKNDAGKAILEERQAVDKELDEMRKQSAALADDAYQALLSKRRELSHRLYQLQLNLNQVGSQAGSDESHFAKYKRFTDLTFGFAHVVDLSDDPVMKIIAASLKPHFIREPWGSSGKTHPIVKEPSTATFGIDKTNNDESSADFEAQFLGADAELGKWKMYNRLSDKAAMENQFIQNTYKFRSNDLSVPGASDESITREYVSDVYADFVIAAVNTALTNVQFGDSDSLLQTIVEHIGLLVAGFDTEDYSEVYNDQNLNSTFHDAMAQLNAKVVTFFYGGDDPKINNPESFISNAKSVAITMFVHMVAAVACVGSRTTSLGTMVSDAYDELNTKGAASLVNFIANLDRATTAADVTTAALHPRIVEIPEPIETNLKTFALDFLSEIVVRDAVGWVKISNPKTCYITKNDKNPVYAATHTEGKPREFTTAYAVEAVRLRWTGVSIDDDIAQRCARIVDAKCTPVNYDAFALPAADKAALVKSTGVASLEVLEHRLWGAKTATKARVRSIVGRAEYVPAWNNNILLLLGDEAKTELVNAVAELPDTAIERMVVDPCDIGHGDSMPNQKRRALVLRAIAANTPEASFSDMCARGSRPSNIDTYSSNVQNLFLGSVTTKLQEIMRQGKRKSESSKPEEIPNPDTGGGKRRVVSKDQRSRYLPLADQYIKDVIENHAPATLSDTWGLILAAAERDNPGASSEEAQTLGSEYRGPVIRKALFNVQTPNTDPSSVTKALGYALNTKLAGVPLTPRLADALYALLPTPKPPEAKLAKAATASTVFLQRALKDFTGSPEQEARQRLASMYEHEYRRSTGKAFQDMCSYPAAPNDFFKEIWSTVCSRFKRGVVKESDPDPGPQEEGLRKLRPGATTDQDDYRHRRLAQARKLRKEKRQVQNARARSDQVQAAGEVSLGVVTELAEGQEAAKQATIARSTSTPQDRKKPQSDQDGPGNQGRFSRRRVAPPPADAAKPVIDELIGVETSSTLKDRS